MFPFLTTRLISGTPNDKSVVATDNKMVDLNHDIHLKNMMICNIEKTDEPFLLHTLDVSKNFARVLIKTVDVQTNAAVASKTSLLSKDQESSLAKENSLNLFKFMKLYRICVSWLQLTSFHALSDTMRHYFVCLRLRQDAIPEIMKGNARNNFSICKPKQDYSKFCRELIKYTCQKSCKGRCNCRKQELHCTKLCNCAG